jgi:hypothetical protein
MTIEHPADGTAIFKPNELRKFIRAIPRIEDQIKFEALLYTGCRYVELQECHGLYGRLKNNSLKVMNTKTLARKRAKFRYVHLNPQGERAIEQFFRGPPLPSYNAWWQNLKRWTDEVDIEVEGTIGGKSTRKTWESYLIAVYPELSQKIFLSQGHSDVTALHHYLAIPFTEGDKKEMLYFVEGW